jgi:hypothetical protein
MFGHCSQELTNLCLIGKAVTNVFDGNIKFEDDADSLTLKGITQTPDVGFLSALEPLRLCEVGKLLKQPRFPIWVIGSASHYTVVFADGCSINHLEPLAHGAVSSDTCEKACCGVCGGAPHEQATHASLFYYNGRDCNAGCSKAVHVDLTFKTMSTNQTRYEPGPLPGGDQDSQLFAEVLKSRWPGAEISFPPGICGTPVCPPRLI